MLRFFRTLYLKWILKDCPHFCKFCHHRNVCPIGSKELTAEEIKMNCEVKKDEKLRETITENDNSKTGNPNE